MISPQEGASVLEVGVSRTTSFLLFSFSSSPNSFLPRFSHGQPRSPCPHLCLLFLPLLPGLRRKVLHFHGIVLSESGPTFVFSFSALEHSVVDVSLSPSHPGETEAQNHIIEFFGL